MHGLDSNVLLRFVLEDDPAQYELARRFFGRCTRESPAYVNLMVLCEFVWVLTTGARRPRAEIASLIAGLLQSPEVKMEHEDIVLAALPLYEHGKADLADILIGLVNARAGCTSTHTFDREAVRSGGLELLSH